MPFTINFKKSIVMVGTGSLLFTLSGCSNTNGVGQWLDELMTNEPANSTTHSNASKPATAKSHPTNIKAYTLKAATKIKTFDFNLDNNGFNSEDDVQSLFVKQANAINQYLAAIQNLNQYDVAVNISHFNGYNYSGGDARQLATVTLQRKTNADDIKPANHNQVIYKLFNTHLNSSEVKQGLHQQDSQINKYLQSVKDIKQYRVTTQFDNISSRMMGNYSVIGLTLVKR